MKPPTLIHERIESAGNGRNKAVICRMKSGWAVLGDDQRLRGYSLLLHDPAVECINDLDMPERIQFLSDMTIIGDALTAVLNPSIINYSILGNLERALHAHIHPRYDSEDPEKRKTHPVIYHLTESPERPFDFERDRELIAQLRAEILKRKES